MITSWAHSLRMTQENPRFAAARIKKLMQADDDVGRISASVPPLVSRCVELFAEELIDRAAAVAQSEDTGGGAIKVSRSDGVRTLKVKHLQQAVKADAQFEMLGGVVAACEDEQAAGKRKAASGASSPCVGSANSRRHAESCRSVSAGMSRVPFHAARRCRTAPTGETSRTRNWKSPSVLSAQGIMLNLYP